MTMMIWRTRRTMWLIATRQLRARRRMRRMTMGMGPRRGSWLGLLVCGWSDET